jgi:hypothetical protein
MRPRASKTRLQATRRNSSVSTPSCAHPTRTPEQRVRQQIDAQPEGYTLLGTQGQSGKYASGLLDISRGAIRSHLPARTSVLRPVSATGPARIVPVSRGTLFLSSKGQESLLSRSKTPPAYTTKKWDPELEAEVAKIASRKKPTPVEKLLDRFQKGGHRHFSGA